MHAKTHTTNNKPFSCDHCCTTFSLSSSMTEPFSPSLHKQLLLTITPSLTSYPGYHSSPSPLPRVSPNLPLQLSSDSFYVGGVRGEGGYATVYSASWDGAPSTCEDAVLKVADSPSDWEWYVTTQVQYRVGEMNHPDLGYGFTWQTGFMFTPSCYSFSTGTILVSQQQRLGTLLDLVNLMRDVDRKLVEPLALCLVADLLGLVELLHSVDIVHADIKPDNLLIRFLPGNSSLDSSPCLQLIDFGKSLDLQLLPQNILFDEVVETDGLKCVEMREGRPWLHHIDLFGVAGTAYCLLFQDYMDVAKVGGRWVVKGAFKRWWQADLWKQFFDDLLNLKGAARECLPSLVDWRKRLLTVFRDNNMEESMDKLEEVLARKINIKRRRTM